MASPAASDGFTFSLLHQLPEAPSADLFPPAPPGSSNFCICTWRVKTQCSLPHEEAVLILLYGLVRLQKIDGYRQLCRVIKEKKHDAA